MSDDTDHTLMRDVARGSASAFTRLYQRHHVALFNYFRRQGQSRACSEDLLHDTWLRILRYADSYREDARFTPWMYRIARNVLADTRKPGRNMGVDNDVEPDEMPDTAEAGPAALYMMSELDARLARALQRMPADKRELVLLSRVRQLSLADLARLFDCSVPTIKVRLHRSLRQLRDYFDDEGHVAPERGHDDNDPL